MWIQYTAYPFQRPEILTEQQYANLKARPEIFSTGLTAMDEHLLKNEYGPKSNKGILCLLWNIAMAIIPLSFIAAYWVGFTIVAYLVPISMIFILVGHSSKMSKKSLQARIRKTRIFARKLKTIALSTDGYEDFCIEYREIGRIRLFSSIPAR